jgi:hypothetical protein
MPLEIHPVQESDFPDFVQIQLAAFAGAGMPALLTPKPVTDSYIQHAIEKHVKSWREEPDVHYLKVIDTALNGKMIACGKWRINTKERTEEQIQSMLPKPGQDEEGRPAAIDFMNYLSRVRKEWMGTKPYYCKHSPRQTLYFAL